jgi:hypothetical protein
MLGVIAQLAVLALIEDGHPYGVLAALVIFPPTLLPTVCVAWVISRSRVTFPGSRGGPIALVLGSWHLAFISTGLLKTLGVDIDEQHLPFAMSVLGTVPIAFATWWLTRRWEMACAIGLLGAGLIVGWISLPWLESGALALLTTVVWVALTGCGAGIWLARVPQPTRGDGLDPGPC